MPMQLVTHRSDKLKSGLALISEHLWKVKQTTKDYWAIRLNFYPKEYCSAKNLSTLFKKIHKIEFKDLQKRIKLVSIELPKKINDTKFEWIKWKIFLQKNSLWLAIKFDASLPVSKRTQYFRSTSLRGAINSIARREKYDGSMSMVFDAIGEDIRPRLTTDS